MTPPRKVLKAVSSVKLAITLLAIIAAVMIVATIISTIKGQRHAQRYIYHSWWFISLLGLFCLNLVLCTWGRWSLRLKRLGTTVTHAGVLVMAAGAVIGTIWGERGTVQLYIGDSDNACYASEGVYRSDGIIYESLEEAKSEKAEHQSSGFQGLVREHRGRYLLYKRPANEITLPFRVHLQDFWVERYPVLVVEVVDPPSVQAFLPKIGETVRIADTPYSVTPLRYEPHFVVLGPGKFGSQSDEPKNQALQVRVQNGLQNNSLWVFVNFPGIHQDPNSNIRLFYRQSKKVKDYKSKVQLFQGGKVLAAKTVEVNKPLKYRGYSIYQFGWDDIAEQYSVFEIARDPGIPFIYLGFLVISAGVLFTFYVRPVLARRVAVRPKPRANGD